MTLIKDKLILNSNGKLTFSQNNIKTNYRRPSEMATVIEDKLPKNINPTVTLGFTSNTDKGNDVNSTSFSRNSGIKYLTKPSHSSHSIKKAYSWVTDPETPLVMEVTYYNDLVPLNAVMKIGYRKRIYES